MEIKVVVLNDEGLHARPAGLLVKTATKYSAKIELSFNDNRANAKSIMSLMSLGLTKDAEVTVFADGVDAEVALTEIKTLFINRFHL